MQIAAFLPVATAGGFIWHAAAGALHSPENWPKQGQAGMGRKHKARSRAAVLFFLKKKYCLGRLGYPLWSFGGL